MKQLIFAAFAATTLISGAAVAEECAGCPRVQLLRAEDQIRIAAQDDNDPYESLRHRVRFVTSNGNSAWTDWADTNAYGLRTATAGQIEAESIDLEGNVGRAVIRITAPDVPAGSRGPGTVEEDSSVEARWDGVEAPDGTTAADLDVEVDRTEAGEWLEPGEWDHSVCPVEPANWTLDEEDDGACSTTQGPNQGLLAMLLSVAVMLFGRARR